MTFEEWKKQAIEFETKYKSQVRADPNLSIIDKLEIDYWDMVEYQLHDKVTI